MPKYHHDEEFESLKSSRKERKRLSEKDRSKYKKSDRDKRAKSERQEVEDFSRFSRGRVLSVGSQGIIVDDDGRSIICTLRGILKKEKYLKKNLVTVGDFVRFDKLDESEGVIEFIEKRHSVLSRADAISRKKEQLIAANIDQVLITASVVAPPLIPTLIDRYIIAAKKGNMEPVILINKIDLLEEDTDEYVLFKEVVQVYRRAGLKVIPISVNRKAGLDELRSVMHDKASVFSGQSGTGKSSLINAVTGLDLPVGDTVKRTRKGTHTTSTAHLVRLEFGGFCIDTPGIKSFGLWDLEKQDVERYFSEIYETKSHCKFPDCTHTHEKNCAVIDAVEGGEISSLRYGSYTSLIEEIEQGHKKR